MQVAIIDYGSGNLCSAAKAFERAAREAGVDANIAVTDDPARIAGADRIVLPGVGAYADCRAGLTAIEGMYDTLQAAVIDKARPFLGICVGMQLMASRGLEHGETPGFNWIKGDVVRITPQDPQLKVPHMGWNTLSLRAAHPLFEDINTGPEGLHAYFVHSYHFAVADRAQLLAETDYGGPITAAVARDNMVGLQFHPEKSQTLGLKLIANFLNWKP
ncbi:MAG: imidazole glycerol phosphate synthase subunit HisH [Hyphomicrobiales bacterium]|nr:MAG: imidazole glycerol phosphate synthase subunit HisH [Hyphomicrobiales bacterium]